MNDLAELERRITYALERIGKRLEGMGTVPPAPADAAVAPAAPEGAAPAVPVAVPVPALAEEVERLRAALAEERTLTAQLQERLRAVREKDSLTQSQAEEKIERMTRQLDVQGLELQRMRRTAIALREQLRALREAAAAGIGDAHLVNKAMLAELDALRATRLTELAEMEEILAELSPLIAEAENA